MVYINESPSGLTVERALEIAEEIQDLAEELPERAEEFAASITEQAGEIAADIEEHGRVTERQAGALQNMLDGVQRWFDR